MSDNMLEVYKAINDITLELSKEGIAKDRKNTAPGQSYNFRGIDDVYNELSPLLAKHHLCIIPRVLSRECVERVSKAGGALFSVALDVEFDFVSSVDGSRHTARTFGEAMDSSDKATNKAMSAAYKYVCFMTFAIPTEGENDADEKTPEPLPKATTAVAPKPPAGPKPIVPKDFKAFLEDTKDLAVLESMKRDALFDLRVKASGEDGPAVLRLLDARIAELAPAPPAAAQAVQGVFPGATVAGTRPAFADGKASGIDPMPFPFDDGPEPVTPDNVS